MQRMKISKAISALLMTLVLIFQMLSPVVAFAATADRDTTTKYTESLGDEASTEYAGRIWTDKSVFTNDVTFATYGGGTETVTLNADNAEDFLISYSALATSMAVSGQSQAPVDVVLVLDISGSMSNDESNMDNGKSRIYNTIVAAEAAIDSLMEMNPYNRVAVAVFSSNSQVLMPLDRYQRATTTKRQWVSTGSWGGYWDEVIVDVPYFSLNRDTASDRYAELTTRAVRQSNSQAIDITVDVEGGTNIQMGLYEGMQILANEAETKASVNGTKIQRVPSVVLLSDGSPTYSSDSDSWWAPSDNYNDGPGSSPYAGNGMKAILVGAYMKDAIDRNYGVANTAYATTVYTVGMGITGLVETEKNLAYMTLDPGTHWDSSVNNTMKTAIKGYWADYTARNNTGTLNINVGKYSNKYEDDFYALTHPTTGYDVDPTDGYDYVDDYYDADNASAVTDVFRQIVSNIAISAPQVPTEIKGDDPLTDGYITYTDPIGHYMQVKDVKAVIYAGTKFTRKDVSVSGDTTSYIFGGEVHSPVYGDQSIENILITVTRDAAGHETLTVKIPASVIPLRVNTVQLNQDGSVKSHTNNGAFPARVVYSVGMRSDIKQVAEDGDVYVDTTKIDADYLLKHTNADGSINFYSNVFTNTNEVNGSTAGDATVEFEPAHNNPFYYIQEDMPIYLDAEFRNQATGTLAPDTVYYYNDVYYHGTTVESRPIARTGEQLLRTDVITGADGFLYRAAGSPRLNRILRFEGTKTDNATGTAEDFYAPIFVHAEGSSDPYEGKFVIYHGNNGVISLLAGGNLEISKDVATAAGLTAPDKAFTFTLDLNGEEVSNGEYVYVIRDAQQNEVSRGTVSKQSPTVTLSDGQTATIYSLPPMTTYTITETAVDGFASKAEGASGTIHAGHTHSAVFTNTYSVTSVTTENLTGTKLLQGRDWAAADSFTFFLRPYNNCPLPAGYDVDQGVTVTMADADSNGLATFTFGQIEFTAPGTYRYTVAELEPENDQYLPGMTYSRALYRIVYVVVDDGAGKLSIDAARSGIQKLYDDDANRLFTYNSNNQIVMNPGQEAQDAIHFTNTYIANSVLRVPTALKAYSDPSGTKPLESGMFRFRIRALGYIVDDGALQTDISKVPMPAGSLNGEAITTNEGHNVTFPAIEFAQSLLTDNGATKMTYRYEMSEVIPPAADRIPGMSYDDSTFVVDVTVQIDPASAELVVSANVPNGQRQPIFENSYTLAPVSGTISGTKTLLGRDMLPGEKFEFSLVGADATTNMAVRDGIVNVPESSVTVSGADNGQAAAFRFDDITFNRPGTYTFLVTEVPGTAPAVSYDDSKIAVTFQVADSNGDATLDITSVTYSNGKNSADFVNTYTYRFNDTPVSLEGTKYLTGKSLVEGEFYFNVQAYYGSNLLTEYLVSHDVDNTATNGVYEGHIVFLSDATYSEPGTYTYYITEQIPEQAVGGTEYDASEYRFTVVITDDGNGSLKVTSKTLERREGGNWTGASDVRFTNAYVPNATTAQLPLIKKVISGDRSTALQAGEFRFRLSVTSAEPADGIVLPAQTEVGNAQNGDILFDPITFTKAGIYRVSVSEVIPEDSQKVPGITYSTQRIDAVYRVIDDRNGHLTAVLTQFEGDTIINTYVKQPDSVTISGTKVLVGGGLKAGDFRFKLYQASDDTFGTTGAEPLQTVSNAADGSFVFDKDNVSALNFTEAGTYYFVLMEDLSNPIEGIRYDTSVYHLQVDVIDDGEGNLVATLDCVNGDENSIVFTNIPHDEIVKKESALVGEPTVNIDGKKVASGQTLRYSISYHNYTGAPADVTVTDTIPAGTTFVSADNGGTFDSGVITWLLTDVAAGADVTVTFDVKVNETATTLENQAVVVEGTNEYKTNVVTNPVTEDLVVKDVFLASAPTVSIDGQKVAVGETLQYAITYTNADDAATNVTITDTIPAHTTYVDGSASDGAAFASGKLTWNLSLTAGETKTVTFQVKVDAPDAFIDNQATAQEGNNTIETNVVTNHTFEEVGGKDVALESAPSISIDGKQVAVGEILVYTITYTNVTGAPVDVVITDTIPAHTELYNAGTGKVDGNTLTWEFAAVQPRQTVTATFLVKVTEPGDIIENQAQIFDGTNKLTNKVTNAVPGKTVDKQAVSVGDELTYVLSYRNVTGKSAKVVIVDKLPAALQYVEGTAGTGVYDNGTITWTFEDVPAGRAVSVSFKAIVKQTGDITNQGTIYENDVEVSFTNKTVTKAEEAELAIRKEQAVGSGKATNGKLAVKAGDEVTYTLTLTNSGKGAANNVVVTDKLPAGLSFVSADNGGTLVGSTVTWNLATVASGETVVLTFRAKVPTVQKDTVWKNVAAFTYQGDTTPTNEVEIEWKVPVTPETGDDFSVLFFLGMMLLSSFGIAAVMICKKRHEAAEEDA